MLLQVTISTTCTNELYSVLMGMTNKSCKLMSLIKLISKRIAQSGNFFRRLFGDLFFT